MASVSIHAPARGATPRFRRPSASAIDVSIHAPARGATMHAVRSQSPERCFNPRSRAGSDTRSSRSHASERAFQSTLPRGERHCAGLCCLAPRAPFQSTLPRGERHRRPHGAITQLGRFNPRSRAGSDLRTVPADSPVACFNPRSRAGSDRPPRFAPEGSACFNPRSRAGSDRDTGDQNGRYSYGFNPRSRAGSDPSATCSAQPEGQFQSTLPRGERHSVV